MTSSIRGGDVYRPENDASEIARRRPTGPQEIERIVNNAIAARRKPKPRQNYYKPRTPEVRRATNRMVGSE
jgi:hypothetical protein